MITENEFCLGSTCPTKILHSRSDLPRNDRDNSFAAWMISETAKVHALAAALFPSAINAHGSIEETQRLLVDHDLVANARFEGKGAACKIDFVERSAERIRLYSVLAKPFDPLRHEQRLEFHSQAGNLRREWREHFELMALRALVVRQLYPESRISCLAVVPSKGAAAAVEGLHGCFECDGKKWMLHGAAAAPEAARLLRIVDVTREASSVATAVLAKVEALSRYLANAGKPELGYLCKKCEFRTTGTRSGFNLCWGPLADVSPHMFDLAYMYFIQEAGGQPVANRLAKEGRVSLWDIPEDRIDGEYAERQLLQLEGTRSGQEIIRPGLGEEMKQAVYPLHFLDFETVRSLLPVHQGSTVGGLTLFQFSVHCRNVAGGELEHVAWLNTEESDPNRRFLAALRSALGDTGTVLVWTHYEENSFCELLAELIGAGIEGPDLEWLMRLLSSGRILDMHELCFRHYWHPRMKGRTSIKVVLPAVWSGNSPVTNAAPYARFSDDPYTFLKSIGAVGDGCAAMEAYLAMQTPGRREEMAAELLRYCGIDTLAMVFVWDYWQWRLRAGSNEATVDLGAAKGGI